MREVSLSAKDIFYRTNSMGLVEAIDAVSGEVLSVENSYNSNHYLNRLDDLIKVTLDDGSIIYSSKGLSLDGYKKSNYSFSKPIADVIAQQISEGKTMSAILKQEGMPSYSTVLRWLRSNSEFKADIEEARIARAEVTHDEIVDIAHTLPDVSEIDSEKLMKKAQLLKWSAEKSDPARFGGKGKEQQTGAVQIIINTGISREEVIEVKNES